MYGLLMMFLALSGMMLLPGEACLITVSHCAAFAPADQCWAACATLSRCGALARSGQCCVGTVVTLNFRRARRRHRWKVIKVYRSSPRAHSIQKQIAPLTF